MENKEKQKNTRTQYTLEDLVNKFNNTKLQKTKERPKNGKGLGSRT